MRTFSKQSDLRIALDDLRSQERSLALVPTMGNLHRGHMKLIAEATKVADCVLSTIFVNPLQFGENEDLHNYPRTLEKDQEKLNEAGCQLLYAPSPEDIYHGGLNQQTQIHVPGVSENFCGASRPGHFDGVATVVNKLFNIVQPQKALFGLKDYQQFLLIKKMVADLSIPVEILGVETVRHESGLALSSRNNYLSEEQRQTATALYRSLCSASESILAGDQDFPALESQARKNLLDAGLKADYLSICDATDLSPATATTKDIAILAAAVVGTTRLIDNLRFSRQ